MGSKAFAVHSIGGTSPSSATTSAGTKIAGSLEACESLTIVATLTGATGGTLDVYLQTSFDQGTTWYDFAHFAQVAGAAAAITKHWHVGRQVQSATGATTIGSGTSPALAANTILGGGWGDMMRVVYTAGAGTSAGAAQSILVIGHRP